MEEIAARKKAKLEALRRLRAKLNNIKHKDEIELFHEECAVCLADLFEEDGRGEVSQIKQCGHAFHTHCITEWFKI